ncbi:zinc-finger domain-containing protein [Methylocystis heyeri]|uniref:Zinc-finger domain-containing protein n=1 Tax=Methylocystis heyeri TaxID=391905 RepID=A0A6B8KFN5_9HYPH|nr:zinc-finger domain-containing protein [Methylocystis heyeri]
MEPRAKPHFHNTPGLRRIKVGVKKFMCVVDLPPFDHPHIFVDMGTEDESVCPYCSTVFACDGALSAPCDPPECEYKLEPETDFSGPAPDVEIGEGYLPCPPGAPRSPDAAMQTHASRTPRLESRPAGKRAV